MPALCWFLEQRTLQDSSQIHCYYHLTACRNYQLKKIKQILIKLRSKNRALKTLQDQLSYRGSKVLKLTVCMRKYFGNLHSPEMVMHEFCLISLLGWSRVLSTIGPLCEWVMPHALWFCWVLLIDRILWPRPWLAKQIPLSRKAMHRR